MPVLVIHQGNDDLVLEPSTELTYTYRIGAGRIIGRECNDLNDAAALNRISKELRDRYVSWVYEFNKEFLEAGLVWEETSLFFLSDLSTKRNELFDTYNTLSVLVLIKEALGGEHIANVVLNGCDRSFAEAVRSAFPHAVHQTRNSRHPRVRLPRRIFADIRFAIYLGFARFLNLLLPSAVDNGSRAEGRYFFSFFPQTFDQVNEDIRYGEDVREEDRYLVAVMADGMHQQLSPFSYWRNRKRIPARKFIVIDEGIRLADLLLGIRIWWKMFCFSRSRKGVEDVIFGLNISGYIQEELIWSISRVARLVMFSKALDRVLADLRITELVYIVFEYPLGRAISALVGRKFRKILRVGFNHGECSWRFLNYFLHNGEPSAEPPYLEHCPIPDEVLAESPLAASIYQYSGYQNIKIMKTVPRLKYLKKINFAKRSSKVLIVAGLHDGEDLLRFMIPMIMDNSSQTYHFRPHPRGQNAYLKETQRLPKNMIIDRGQISDALSEVESLYVTYSGLGPEVASLGIPVKIVCIPGRINWSKGIDELTDGPRNLLSNLSSIS